MSEPEFDLAEAIGRLIDRMNAAPYLPTETIFYGSTARLAREMGHPAFLGGDTGKLIRTHVVEGLPADAVYLVPSREPDEGDVEFYRRCVALRDIGGQS